MTSAMLKTNVTIQITCKEVYCKKFQLFTTITTLEIVKLQYHPQILDSEFSVSF